MNKGMRSSVGLVLLLALAITGCAGQVSDLPVADILAGVVDVIKADLLAEGVEIDDTEAGLPGFMETDLLTGNLNMVLAAAESLDPQLIAEGVALQSMYNVNSTEILIIKAKSKAAAKDLEAALQQEKSLRLKQWESYLPAQYDKVKNTIIKVQGVHLLYVTYDHPAKIEAVFAAALQD